MPNFVIAIVVVFGGYWLIRKFGKLSPAASRGLLQKLAGGAIMAFSGLLAFRGQMNIAVPVFLFGAGLVGKSAIFPNGFSWGGTKSPGQKSRVATALLSMELDHDTGGLDGEVLSGPAKGKRLAQLSESELKAFHALCKATQDQSSSLYEAWLDRHKPEWRASWGVNRDGAHTAAGPMGKGEARAILGLKDEASEEDIRAAHRRLMKEFHPDKGGSDYLAAKINAAKDVLLGG
jgi:DnaJ domain